MGEIQAQPFGDLLGAPGAAPAPVFARAVTAAGPLHLRARNGNPVRPLDSAAIRAAPQSAAPPAAENPHEHARSDPGGALDKRSEQG